MKRILVIRLGALGDFAQSFPAFAAIRAHHAADQVTLLTTPPFAGLALESPWFDQVRVDTRPAWFDVPAMLRLRRQRPLTSRSPPSTGSACGPAGKPTSSRAPASP